MLGAMLAWTDRLNEASSRFDEAIALCEATGDTLHLGVALNNRMVLHVQRRDVAGARADLERAVSLGRELGNVQIERTSAFNLALLLGYQGRAVEALPWRGGPACSANASSPAPWPRTRCWWRACAASWATCQKWLGSSIGSRNRTRGRGCLPQTR
ncbi:tetratricopeptide repeat protein [Myxococcus sp. MxC21-1]|uniref:tetratricopeptide repeat protein n=1 Tax=Myxococcus sp. MxC21-1 TaxID=3041439 RepID=UPI00292E6925|nr:tetratricopeptide repeat protein [Myxococcus sp. MxC21-1]WNZ59029.1 tetratricopeptide repeat protein [Myxococcus sp. MxC21-1]